MNTVYFGFALMEGYLLLRTYICMWYSPWTTVVTKRLNNSSIWSSPAARLTATTKYVGSRILFLKEEILTVLINWTTRVAAAVYLPLSR